MVARDPRSFEDLAEIARQIRRDVVTMTHVANSGHAGGPLSSADYLTYLFFNELRLDPREPRHPDRDRFILSNGLPGSLTARAAPWRSLAGPPSSSTWPFSEWGLPCRGRRRPRGGLLPHRFTLA